MWSTVSEAGARSSTCARSSPKGPAPSVSYTSIARPATSPPWSAPSSIRRARKSRSRRRRIGSDQIAQSDTCGNAEMKIGLLCGREYSFPPAFLDRVIELGTKHGITAEFVKLGGTRMGEPSRYRVIVDRISHEVEYYRAYLKHAVLEGAYVINNPFWWTADDKFFNYSVAQRLGVAVPKTVVLPQKSYPPHVDLTPESLRNLGYPIDWDGLLEYVGRPAILKPYSGGGWKHVYKVHDASELVAAYDGTGPYCMTLQEFIDFDQYVRCFTFGKSDIVPVAYDPRQRRYLVEHEYLSPTLGERIVRDAQTINIALGYEMNTIEFAVSGGGLCGIDFL